MWWFYRKGPSGFSGASTAEEVTAGVDGRGLVAVITGASSGIGLETARVLALRSVRVVMAVRNVSAGFKVREAIQAEIPGARLDVLELDLMSMDSVRRFASEFDSLNLPLNVLINNAGVMTRDCTRSCDGIELHFATNHIGHFLLTNLLLENMKSASRDSSVEGRIINVSSAGHIMTYPEGIRFDKIHDPSGRCNGFIAYGQSKLANILHTNELSRILKEEGVNISANAVHPGLIVTSLFRNMSIVNALMNSIGRIMSRSVEQVNSHLLFFSRLVDVLMEHALILASYMFVEGAATTCYVAIHPHVKGVTGEYFGNCNIATPSRQASDAELAKKLWQFSLKMVSC